MSRPEVLFPLFADLTGLPGVGARTAKLFEKLGATRVVDLLMLAPTGVVDRRPTESLVGMASGTTVTVAVEVGERRRGRSANSPYRITVRGGGQAFELLFFRAKGDWLAQQLPRGARRVVSGRVEFWEGRMQMPHPDLILTEAEAAGLPPFEPVYPLTQGLGQRAVAKAVTAALTRLPALDEWLDAELARREGWPGWARAVRALHTPDGRQALSPAAPARQRLAYDELLSHQLALQLSRARMKRGTGRRNVGSGELQVAAAEAFGYAPTAAQERALAEITADMADETRMMRLLQGDVGSGKTWVAAMMLLVAVEAGGQGALMAPTEILARQHAMGLAPIAEAAGLHLTLLTGRDKGGQRADRLDRIADGRAQIIVGTHALFSRDVGFHDLRAVVIDEQHRFGVRQRMELTAKAPRGADVLVMTATPIPRTLALAGYGDLDISVLDEKPPGRQPIETRLVSMSRYGDVVERLRAALAQGRRAYWVCPLVEESAESDLVAAEARARELAGALGPDTVALVHGQMSAAAKDAAMADFQTGRRQVLVATTVVEVGVDVPEATIMVIEQAESFGLAQLHQLRGRVGRGQGQSFCLLLFRPPLGETAEARLAVMRDSQDGFRIAEEDLRLRGAGDLLGTAQSGLPRFRIADLQTDARLSELAREDARMTVHSDPDLASPRGRALRTLLYLMERESSVRLLKGG